MIFIGRQNMSQLRSHLTDSDRYKYSHKKEHHPKIRPLVELLKFHGLKKSEINTFVGLIQKDRIKKHPNTKEEKLEQVAYIADILLDDEMIYGEEYDFMMEYGSTIGLSRIETHNHLQKILKKE